MTCKFSSAQIEKVSGSPTLKLPHLFNLTPNSSGKGHQAPKQHPVGSQTNQETLPAPKTVSPPFTIDEDGEAQGQRLQPLPTRGDLQMLKTNSYYPVSTLFT